MKKAITNKARYLGLKLTAIVFALLLFASGEGWGANVTYTITAKNTLGTTGTAPSGSNATIVETYTTSKQMTSGNSQTLTLSGYSGYKITSITLSMRSNTSAGSGNFIYKIDGGSDNTIIATAAFNDASWYGAWSTSYVDVVKAVNIICGATSTVLKIAATANSLYCQSYSLTYEAVSSNDQTSKVESPTTQTSSGDIASTATASGSAIDVFKFKISDLGTADGLATKVTQVKIKKSSGTADWTDHIAGAELWDGASKITTGAVAITDNDITFPITSGNLDIANNGNKEITLKIWLKTTNIVDNATMVFTVSQTSHGFTADAAGSSFASDFGAAVTGNTMTVRVAATKLLFTTAPSTTACPNTNLTTPPVVKATDANGATDADFTGEVTLTNSGSIGMSNYQMNAAAGVATYTNLQFTATGNVTLTAGASGLTSSDPTASIAISVSNVSSPAATNGNALSLLTWTNPSSCYDEIMIVAKAASAVTATPSGDGTAYTANLAFTSGTEFDGGYVVYKGTTSSQTVIGLTNGTTYHFTFFTRKGTNWSNGITTTATPAFASSASDHFRTKAIGNWNAIATWESSTDGSTNWINATLTPTSSANTITILNGHTVTVTASVSIDQVTVNTGGKIIVNSSQTLTIANGADTYDMTVNGTVENSGTINTTAGAVKFESGGYYKHTGNGGSMVAASWDANSTCEITGMTSATSLTNFGSQVTSYGNLIWNCTGQTAWFSATGSFDVAGNFIINSTGGGVRGINLVTASTNRTFNITGNMEINGSKITLTNASGIATLNIGGNLSLNSSSLNQLDFGYSASSTAPTSGNYRSIINLQGNFSNGSSSVVKITDATYYGKIVFAKNGNQTYTNLNTNATMNGIDHLVNSTSTLQLATDLLLDNFNEIVVNGTIDFATYRINGASANNLFTLNSGANCKVGHASGLNYAINVGGSKTLNTGANYEFNGSSAQVTGSLLPATVNNLTIDNAAGVTLSNSTLTVNGTLLINSGKKLEIGVDKQLTVSGTLTNNGGAAGLVLKSDATGTASLINSTAGVNATVERYITHYTSNTDGWRLVSSPVNAAAIGNFAPGTNDDFYGYDEANNLWINYKVSPFGFTNGLGYLSSYETSATKSFSGALNTADVTITNLSLTPTKGNGWQLLGNPYASAIKWNDGNWTLSNVNTTAKRLNNGGTYTDLAANDIIPSMNGFFVQVSNATNSIKIPAASRTHSSANILNKSSVAERLDLKVSSIGNNTYVEATIKTNANATNGFDTGYDANFLAGMYGAPQLYSIVANGNLSTNSIPTISGNIAIPLGFVPGIATNYSFSADGLANFSHCTSITLEDLKTNTTQNLMQNPVYSFTAATTDNANRFVLHFATAVGVNEIGNSNGSIYAYDNSIYVNANEQIKQISVYNAMGQLVKTLNNVNGLQKINMNGNATGYYIVRVVSDRNVYSEKVLVK